MTVNAQRLRELPGNDRCADCQDCDCPHCGFPDAIWACEELGIMVCEECMSMHQMLTKSKFKSVICQDWTEESYQNMASTNNNVSKEIYENSLSPAFKKPTRCFDVNFRRQWIISKYIRREFSSPDNLPNYTLGKKCGYLWKRGRDGGVFLRRWFVLDSSGKGKLRYYTDANEQNLRGEISLFQMNMVLASEEKIGHPNGLQLIFPETKGQNTRLIYLYAELAKDMVEWYQAVRCLKFRIKKETRVEKDEEIISRILRYDILKEGYLLKTGAKGKEAFRKRWIVLDPLCLMYFKDPLDANPKGTIPMKAGYSLIMNGQLDPENRGYHFFLKTPGRIYHFIAESDHERKAWFQAIHSACNKASGGHHHKPCASPSVPRKPTMQIPAVPQQDKPKAAPSKFLSDPALKSDPIVDKVESADNDDSFKLSSPFSGVRPSTRPRPAETLKDYHHRHGPGHSPQGRYQPGAELIKQPAIEVIEDDYLEFIPPDSDSEESSEEDEDENAEPHYIEMEGESVVMMRTVDMIGMTTKQLSTHLKVPPGALSQSISCTMCVSLIWNTLPTLPNSEGYVAVCPVVSCCSMPRNVKMIQPFALEIQHSAILKDVKTSAPKVWHLAKEPGKFSKWEAVESGGSSLSCRATDRNVIVSTTKTGCFCVMFPQGSVLGKMVRCMTYMSREEEEDHLVVRVYFFDDNGSDDALHEIQRRENSYSGRLCDISGSFFLPYSQDDILLKLTDFEGMHMYLGSDEPMKVSAHELWHKLLMCYMVEVVKTDSVGQCSISVWHPTEQEKLTQMNLHYSNEKKFSVVAPMPYMQAPLSPLQAVPTRFHQAVTRVSSAPLSPTNEKPCLIANRSRDHRHARSIPCRSTKPADDLPYNSSLGQNQLPFLVKRDLFLLLDPKVKTGKDWRMLASQLGMDAMINSFDMQINPTMEVLKIFEIMDRPIKELEDHLRYMDRNDAADIIKVHLEKNLKVIKPVVNVETK
ncbi:uncharacterized protein [Asterias amurensis]|uniref:uncharacterized protein isoform X2 n=1 Tax=Asterias amurensis TaxID=7602 RepID=UPI003AB7DA09